MKINTQTIIKDFKGNDYKNIDDIEVKTIEDTKTAPSLTLGHVVSKSLANVKSTDALKSYKLVNEFIKGGTVEITLEDVVFIKKILVESEWLPYIIGQVIEILECNLHE